MKRRRRRSLPAHESSGHLAIRAPDEAEHLIAATAVLEAALWDERWSDVSILVPGELTSILEDGPCEPHVVPLGARRDELAVLRKVAPDVLLVLGEDWRAARAGRRARIPVRAGTGTGWRRWWLTHAVVPPRDEGRRLHLPASLGQRDAAGLVGIWPRDLRPRLYVSSEDDVRLRRTLAGHGLAAGARYALCVPDSNWGPSGIWSPERYAALLDHLERTRGWRPLVAVPSADADLADDVVAAARAAIPLVGGTDRAGSLKALVRGAAVVVTADGSARACAAAFDAPCLIVAGPGPSLRGSAVDERARVLRVAGLECAPCLRAHCPLGHHRCMRELEVDTALAAAESLLGPASSRPEPNVESA